MIVFTATAQKKGLPHALIELRQDEIANASGQAGWAAHLVAIMQLAENRDEMKQIRHFGSVNDTPNEAKSKLVRDKAFAIFAPY